MMSKTDFNLSPVVSFVSLDLLEPGQDTVSGDDDEGRHCGGKVIVRIIVDKVTSHRQ